METQTEKKGKQAPKRVTYAAIRVRKDLKRQIESHLERVNKKDFGKRVRAEDYLTLALSLVTPQHINELQESIGNSKHVQAWVDG